MTKKTLINPLVDVEVDSVAGTTAIAMKLTNSIGEEHYYVIDPKAVSKLLPKVLDCASHWAKHSDHSADIPSGRYDALPASRLSLERGRTNKEVALRVLVGKVEIAFLLPLDEVISATASLVERIESDGSPPVH